MIKKFLIFLLGVLFILSGCSKSDDEEMAVSNDIEIQAETEPAKESKPEEPQVIETNSYLISILAEHEDGTYEALGSDGTNYFLALDENFSEDEKELLKPGEALTAEAWEKENKTLCIVKVLVSDDTLEAINLKRAAFERINGFAVDDSITAVMYAKEAVNIRKGPSTDYEQVGKLSYGEEVDVTGMANGWYRISYGEAEAYVSNNYLITTEPKIVASSQTRTDVPGNASAVPSGGDSASALGLPYTEEEIDAVMNSGDLKRAWEMNQDNLDALNGGGQTGGASSGVEASPEPVEKSMASSSEFVNYLNSQREAAGLSKLEWSDSLAQTAKERSGEVVDDFSHNGSRNCSGEIITQTSSSDVSAWYNNFYNSPGHKAHMMDAGLYTKVGAGMCQVGNRYYVVVLFDYTER